MKEFIKDNYVNIIIVLMYVVELITVTIVLWETFTNKSIVDVIWDKIFKEDDK